MANDDTLRRDRPCDGVRNRLWRNDGFQFHPSMRYAPVVYFAYVVVLTVYALSAARYQSLGSDVVVRLVMGVYTGGVLFSVAQCGG